MKKLIFALLISASSIAHAGFITGYLVGSASKTADVRQPTSISSDKYDVIACKTFNGGICYMSTSDDLTPEAFAKSLGYTHVIKKGVLVSGKDRYITMEVTK